MLTLILLTYTENYDMVYLSRKLVYNKKETFSFCELNVYQLNAYGTYHATLIQMRMSVFLHTKKD